MVCVAIAILAGWPPRGTAQEVVTLSTSDGSTAFGTWHRAAAAPSAIIVAFHQGGASGLGEYAPILPRLTGEGYDVLVVDLRAGGDRFGGRNRTVEARGGEAGYCDAAPDVEAAFRHAVQDRRGLPVVLWGSSFSAALVLRLSAEVPAGLAAVLAFSPASGGPMEGCRGEDVSERIQAPVLVLRPRSEMEIPSVAAQAERFRAQGHRTFTADPGAHGSSTLVEDRVGASVEETWDAVLEFLAAALRAPDST
jgi:alpha-beta hydrolase superfamily lysophospholipase